ncbi:MAG TPA: penicillin-binding protein 2 [Candidatus Saccharimonadales bacterium]|nr:penicillin-binding protein 2 [Candidatus Saccharimonadales bacterium]
MKSMKTGAAFSDHIITESFHHSHSMSGGKRSMRGFLLPVFLIVFAGILIVKLFLLQVMQGDYYRLLSDNNRIKTTTIHAPRGIIFDRNNMPLVFNMPGFRQSDLKNAGQKKTTFLDEKEGIARLAAGDKNLEIDSLRQYPYKDALSHVVGYVGEISDSQLKLPQFQSYRGGDIIGKMGIEQTYEDKLKGQDGKTLSEVDASGKIIRKLGQADPIPGQNIQITIDSKLQQAAFTAMKDVKKGAAIVTTPDGQILSLVSKPSFDPNLFTLGQNYKTGTTSGYPDVASILTDGENQPLLNRAISGTYPPGSTFKLVVASSGLHNKIIDQNYQVEDSGILKVGAFSFSNWYYSQYGRTEGSVDVVKGIKRSNDIFFYELAAKIGVDQISKTASEFGLGNVLGIDLFGEEKGIVPTPEWKEKAIGEQWYLGDTYHYGIGQGYLLTTPLQVNGWTQAIANDGTLYQPHLLLDEKPSIKNQNFLDPKTISLVREGMIEACDTGGVAWPLFQFKVKNEKLQIDGKDILPAASSSAAFRHVVVACKTGTAEHGGPTTEPHAWLTAFAPAYHPQIVVTVLVESSGEGSNVAAPIAKKILEEWFGR